MHFVLNILYIYCIMSIFHRQYQTVNSIKDKSVDEILAIERKEINTTKIINDDEFESLHPEQQEAIKYIASRKRVNRTNKIPYKNIAKDFKKLQIQNDEADNMVTLGQLHQIGTEMQKIAIKSPKTPGVKRGGKKTHRKRTYRRRR